MLYEYVFSFVRSYARACFLNRGIPGKPERLQPPHPGAPKTSAETSHLLQDSAPRENEENGANSHGTVLRGVNGSCSSLLYFRQLEVLSMRWHHPV